MVFFDGGDGRKSVLFCSPSVVPSFFLVFFLQNNKSNVTLQFLCVQKKNTSSTRNIHTLFLRIVSARNLLLSSERDTASGIYVHKEVRAL